jgi:hypothetical protein
MHRQGASSNDRTTEKGLPQERSLVQNEERKLGKDFIEVEVYRHFGVALQAGTLPRNSEIHDLLRFRAIEFIW